MVFDEAYLRERFNRFNREVFGNALPTVRFAPSRARTYAAQYLYRKSPLTRRTLPESRCIRYSTFYSFPEPLHLNQQVNHFVYEDFLEHSLRDTSAHGAIFKRLGAEIREKHGYDVCASLKIDVTAGGMSVHGEAMSEHGGRNGSRYFFCLLEIDAEHYGVCTVAKTAIFELWDKLGPAFNCRGWKWYASRHVFFSKFPRSRGKLRYYAVSRTEIQSLAGEMHELVRHGDTVSLCQMPMVMVGATADSAIRSEKDCR